MRKQISEADMEKAQVAKVDDRQEYLTPAGLTFCANFINRFAEVYVASNNGGEPYFCLSDVEVVCTGNNMAETRDLLTLPSENLGGFVLSATEVSEHIRKGSPSPQVAEALVGWFEAYYMPRIRRLPDIYRKLLSDKKTWQWLTKEADRIGTTVEDWVRMQVLGLRDQLLDGIATKINKIKSAIECVLFDDDDSVAGLPDKFDVFRIRKENVGMVENTSNLSHAYNTLSEEYHKVLLGIRELEVVESNGKWCFPARPIVKLLGIQAPSNRNYDEWLSDFIFDLSITNGIIDCVKFDGKVYLPEQSVVFLIHFHSAFPDWVRERLELWFIAYCRECNARSLFANANNIGS